MGYYDDWFFFVGGVDCGGVEVLCFVERGCGLGCLVLLLERNFVLGVLLFFGFVF